MSPKAPTTDIRADVGHVGFVPRADMIVFVLLRHRTPRFRYLVADWATREFRLRSHPQLRLQLRVLKNIGALGQLAIIRFLLR